MTPVAKHILVDTNIWLDYYLPNRPNHDLAARFIELTLNDECTLFYTQGTIKDVFYLIDVSCKRMESYRPGSEAAFREIAWGCIRHMMDIATPAPFDLAVLWLADKYKSIHQDFEDNLVMATAELAPVDMLVTNDKDLVSHAPVFTCTLEHAVEYLALPR